MTFDRPLSQIDNAVLETLLTDAVSEGRQLDYKEQLPGSSDDDKREFLSDVTSFANAAGGDMIFGIRERRDAQGKPTGEPEAVVGITGLNLDAERLRLENLMRDGIAPRTARIALHEIPRGQNAPCLLLRIPKSWSGPHMVTFKNYSRFFSRNSGGKYQLDVGEIRAGFLAAETAQQRIRAFRAERIGRILANETPIRVGDGPKLIFHALPVGSTTDAWNRFLAIEERQIPGLLQPISGHPSSWRFNLDGFVVHTQRDDHGRDCYLQLFRDGGIETVSQGVIVPVQDMGGFHGVNVESELIVGVGRLIAFWNRVEVRPPMTFGLTLTGVRGMKILQFPGCRMEEGTFDADVVVIPEIIVDDLQVAPDLMLRSLFDYLWQGSGWPASPYYRADGRWRER